MSRNSNLSASPSSQELLLSIEKEKLELNKLKQDLDSYRKRLMKLNFKSGGIDEHEWDKALKNLKQVSESQLNFAIREVSGILSFKKPSKENLRSVPSGLALFNATQLKPIEDSTTIEDIGDLQQKPIPTEEPRKSETGTLADSTHSCSPQLKYISLPNTVLSKEEVSKNTTENSTFQPRTKKDPAVYSQLSQFRNSIAVDYQTKQIRSPDSTIMDNRYAKLGAHSLPNSPQSCRSSEVLSDSDPDLYEDLSEADDFTSMRTRLEMVAEEGSEYESEEEPVPPVRPISRMGFPDMPSKNVLSSSSTISVPNLLKPTVSQSSSLTSELISTGSAAEDFGSSSVADAELSSFCSDDDSQYEPTLNDPKMTQKQCIRQYHNSTEDYGSEEIDVEHGLLEGFDTESTKTCKSFPSSTSQPEPIVEEVVEEVVEKIIEENIEVVNGAPTFNKLGLGSALGMSFEGEYPPFSQNDSEGCKDHKSDKDSIDLDKFIFPTLASTSTSESYNPFAFAKRKEDKQNTLNELDKVKNVVEISVSEIVPIVEVDQPTETEVVNEDDVEVASETKGSFASVHTLMFNNAFSEPSPVNYHEPLELVEEVKIEGQPNSEELSAGDEALDIDETVTPRRLKLRKSTYFEKPAQNNFDALKDQDCTIDDSECKLELTCNTNVTLKRGSSSTPVSPTVPSSTTLFKPMSPTGISEEYDTFPDLQSVQPIQRTMTTNPVFKSNSTHGDFCSLSWSATALSATSATSSPSALRKFTNSSNQPSSANTLTKTLLTRFTGTKSRLGIHTTTSLDTDLGRPLSTVGSVASHRIQRFATTTSNLVTGVSHESKSSSTSTTFKSRLLAFASQPSLTNPEIQPHNGRKERNSMLMKTFKTLVGKPTLDSSKTGALRLFKFQGCGNSNNSQSRRLVAVAESINSKLLLSKFSYILECELSIFLWFGKESSDSSQKEASHFAGGLLKNRKHKLPVNLTIRVEFESNESTTFTSKFTDWHANQLDSQGNLIDADNKSNEELIPTEVYHKLVEVYSTKVDSIDYDDFQHLSIKVWLMRDQNSHLELSPNELGIFYDHESYLILLHYRDQQEMDGHVVYYWIGRSSLRAKEPIAEPSVVNLENSKQALMVQLLQGREDRKFINMFDGSIIVRKGHRKIQSRDGPQTPIFHHSGTDRALYHVRGLQSDAVVVDQTTCSSRYLCSGHSFLLVAKSTVYVWHGIGSFLYERLAAVNAAKRLAPPHAKLIEVREKLEPKKFFDKFNDHVLHIQYADALQWARKPFLQPSYDVRLFQILDTSNFKIQELRPFHQKDLQTNQGFLLDSYFDLFLWVAYDKDSTKSEQQNEQLKFLLHLAMTYATFINSSEKRPFQLKPVLVTPTNEPLEFINQFSSWDPNAINMGKPKPTTLKKKPIHKALPVEYLLTKV